MESDSDNDYVLLRRLRRHLQMLDRPGSEAALDMATWPHCVAGYACRLPAFNALGLRFDRGIPRFGPRFGFEALQDFFNLTTRQGDYLFADDPERTGHERIQTFAEARARIGEIIRGEV